MPGSVANAAIAATMPFSLSVAFERDHTYEALINEYADGSSQRRALTATSRKVWRKTKRLTPGEMTALRAFVVARGGSLEAFYYYDPHETAPPYTSTPAGTQGRYTVRLDGGWNQTMNLGRSEVPLYLIELA